MTNTNTTAPDCDYAISLENRGLELADAGYDSNERRDELDEYRRELYARGLRPCRVCEMCAPTPPPWLIEAERDRALNPAGTCDVDHVRAALCDAALLGSVPHLRALAIALRAREDHEAECDAALERAERYADDGHDR